MKKCTCQKCPNCGHLSKEVQGCSVCRDGPEPGKIRSLHCPEHGLIGLDSSKTEKPP